MKFLFFFFNIFVAGLVERVVLLGAPVSIKDENWDEARKVVGCICDFLIGSLYKLFYTAIFFFKRLVVVRCTRAW